MFFSYMITQLIYHPVAILLLYCKVKYYQLQEKEKFHFLLVLYRTYMCLVVTNLYKYGEILHKSRIFETPMALTATAVSFDPKHTA